MRGSGVLGARPLIIAGIVIVAIVVGIVLVATSEEPRSLPPEPAVDVGFNNNAVTQGVATAEQAAERLVQVGADIDRVQINWATLEPSPGVYDFRPYDEVYAADLAAGVKPLLIFAYAPAWAADDYCDANVSSCHLPPTPAHYGDAARTVAAITERYPEAAGIEIWNEPNIAYFWAPGADPVAYAALLEVTADAVKRVDPEMPVVGGSTSSTEVMGRPGYIDAVEFIDAIYAQGAAEAIDALSVHIYTYPGPPSVKAALEQVAEIRAIQREHEDDAPIWVTETGASTTGPEAVSESEQRRFLEALVDRLGRAGGVEMVLLHTLFRRSTDLHDPEVGYGIVDPGGEPLPIFCRLAELWRGSGC